MKAKSNNLINIYKLLNGGKMDKRFMWHFLFSKPTKFHILPPFASSAQFAGKVQNLQFKISRASHAAGQICNFGRSLYIQCYILIKLVKLIHTSSLE